MTSRQVKNTYIYLFLFIFLLLVRLPSFFYSVFDWDESTRILIAQSILNGNVPYVEAWVMKPPGSFYVYSLFIALFGKSIFAIRLGGLLCIYIASVILFKAGEALQGRRSGVIAAIFLIVFVSARKWGLSTMTEHIMLIPISLLLYLLLTKKITNGIALMIGIVTGAGILMRQNMAFDSVAVCVVILMGLTDPEKDIAERVKKCLVFVSGIAVPVTMMLAYYFINNELSLFYRTNILAVIVHVSENVSLLTKINMFTVNISREFTDGNMLLWAAFASGAVYIFFFQKSRDIKRFLSAALIIFSLQLFSIFYTGTRFGYHYMILITPVMSIVCGVATPLWLSRIKKRKRILTNLTVLLIAAGLLLSLSEHVIPRYKNIVSRFMSGEPLQDDTCFRIAGYLDTEDVAGQYIYMVNNCQIVYWLTESRYPTKYVHPSDIIKHDFMLRTVDGPEATDEGELLNILSKEPLFIVFKRDSWPTPDADLKKLLEEELSNNYREVRIVDEKYFIYKREG